MEAAVEGPVAGNEAFTVRVVSGGEEPYYAVHYIVSRTGEYTRDVVLPLERIRRYRAEVQRQVAGLALPELPGWDRKQKRRRKLAKRDFRDELASYFAQLLAHPVLSSEPEVLALLLRMDAPAPTAVEALLSCMKVGPGNSEAAANKGWAKDEKEKRVNFEAMLDSLALDISAVAEQDRFRLGRSCGSLLAGEDTLIRAEQEAEGPADMPAKEDAATRKEWNPVRFFRKPREKAAAKKVLTSTSIDTMATVAGYTPPVRPIYRVLDHVAVLSSAYHLVKATDPSGTLVLLKVQLPAASTRTAPLELEYETMQKLSSTGVCMEPLGLIGGSSIKGARPYFMGLVVKDLRGELLFQHIYSSKGDKEKRPPKTSAVLQLLTGLAEKLATLHGKGVLHGNITPLNVFLAGRWDVPSRRSLSLGAAEVADIMRSGNADPAAAPAPEQARVLLMGFNNARCMFWHDLVSTMEHDLRYCAPEVTANEPLDFKIDLFSLAVTCLEFALGSFPAAVMDRVAATPTNTPASTVLFPEDLPSIDSRVVEVLDRLLQPNPVNRYQSAVSLLHDIEKIRPLLYDRRRSRGEQASIVLGQMDWACQNLLANVGYLWNVFPNVSRAVALAIKRVAKTGASEAIVFRSDFGPVIADIVNHTVEKKNVMKKAFFTKVRVDEHTERPFQGVAFHGIAAQIQSKPDAESRLKKIRQAVGSSGSTVCAIIPELLPLLEEENMASRKMHHQEQFKLLFQKVVAAICAIPGSPLVLWIDNLQSMDKSSLLILSYLLAKTKNILLFASCSGGPGNGDTEAPLALHVKNFLEEKTLNLQELEVPRLSLHQTSEFVHMILGFPATDLGKLCEVVFNVTGGNPQYITALLQVLYSHQQLYFSFTDGTWDWDHDFLKRLPVTNIVEFMKFAIRRIPKATLSVLSVASCMGNIFSLELLKGVVVGELSERIRERLDELVFMRFLTRTGEDTFAFTNSAYQQAAYEFLSEDDRQAIHMKIGFAILKTVPAEVDGRTVELCYQFGRAMKLLQADEKARVMIGQLNLEVASSCLSLACADLCRSYAERGIAILEVEEDPWKSHFSLIFDLKMVLVKSLDMLEMFDECHGILDEMLCKVVDRDTRDDWLLHIGAVYGARLHCLVIQGDMEEGIRQVGEALSYFDCAFIAEPTEEDVVQGLEAVQSLLKRRFHGDLDQVVLQPAVQHYEKVIVQRLLSVGSEMTSFYNPVAHLTCILQLVLVALVNGHCRYSLVAFADYGLLLQNIFNRFDEARDWVGLSRAVEEAHPGLRVDPHCLSDLPYVIVHAPRTDSKETLSELMRLYNIAVENGHFADASYIACYYAAHACSGNVALVELENSIKSFLGLARRVVPASQALNGLMKISAMQQGLMSYNPFEDDSLQLAACKNFVIFQYLRYLCLMNDYDGCRAVLNDVTELLEDPYAISSCCVNWCEYRFVLATFLLNVRTRHNLSSEEGDRLDHLIEKQMHVLEMDQDLPFSRMLLSILNGKKQWGKGRSAEAMGFWTTAELFSSNFGLAYRGALHEMLGKAWAHPAVRSPVAAERSERYLRQAWEFYYDWGAGAKLRQMVASYEPIRRWAIVHARADGPSSTYGESSMFVMKMAKLIMDEMVLGTLYKRVLSEVMNFTGADKIFIIVATTPESPTIECAGNIAQNWSIMHPKSLFSCDVLDHGIVLNVIRTEKAVTISDAANAAGKHSSTYLQSNHVGSVLCCPVTVLRETAAFLYLESSACRMFDHINLALLCWPVSQVLTLVENLVLRKDRTVSKSQSNLVGPGIDSILMQGELLRGDRKTSSWESNFCVVRKNRMDLYQTRDAPKPRRSLPFKHFTEPKSVSETSVKIRKSFSALDPPQEGGGHFYFTLHAPLKKRTEVFVCMDGKQLGRQWLDTIYRAIDREDNQSIRLAGNLTIDPSELVLDRVLGRGAVAVVYVGRWKGVDVAVKKLHGHVSETAISDFLEEIHMLKSLRHPNILLFVGGYSDEVGRPCIVTEFMRRGSLEDVLYDPLVKFSVSMKVEALKQIAQGVLYLHSFSPPIIHRDLKPANILVSENFSMKIGDFGLARACNTTHMTSGQGTVKWMAPEVLKSGTYSELADVYSFALIMWEIWTQKPFYEDIKFNARIEYKVLHEGMRPEIPDDCPKLYADLVRQCWDDDAACRPTFTQILKVLHDPEFVK